MTFLVQHVRTRIWIARWLTRPAQLHLHTLAVAFALPPFWLAEQVGRAIIASFAINLDHSSS